MRHFLCYVIILSWNKIFRYSETRKPKGVEGYEKAHFDFAGYSADGDLIEDGCGKDRTIPIVCNVVDKDGKFGTFEDHFEVCEGDE